MTHTLRLVLWLNISKKPNSKCVDWGETSRKTARMSLPTQKLDVQARFAANMRRLRKAKKLTQERVAELAELHPNYISSVERAERNISLRNIERIALALGVSMADLVNDEVIPAKDQER